MERILGDLMSMIIWLGFFSAVFFFYYFFLKYRNRERLMLIEKGTDVAGFYKKKDRKFPWFIVGFTFLGIGLASGIFFSLLANMGEGEKVVSITLSLSVLFGGVGVIVGNILGKKKSVDGYIYIQKVLKHFEVWILQ